MFWRLSTTDAQMGLCPCSSLRRRFEGRHCRPHTGRRSRLALRKYGMTIDNLLSCQVVTSDSRVLNASPVDHEDLFWALRGGGVNFGVVTSFEFRAHPVHTVLGGLLLYPPRRGGGCHSSLP